MKNYLTEIWQQFVSFGIGAILLCLSLSGFSQTVPLSYFGNHILGSTETSINGSGISTAWPPWNPVTLRLWDNYGFSTQQNSYKTFNWRGINTANGVYDWTLVDKILAKYKSKGVTDLIFTMGYTPTWAAVGGDATGAGVPADTMYIRNFVIALANRAISDGMPIKYWEGWNEPNNTTTSFNGSVNQLITASKAYYNAVKFVNPTYQVLSPSPQGWVNDTTQLNPNTVYGVGGVNGGRWMNTFLSNGGKNYIDIVAFHGYMSGHIPEGIDTTINTYKKAMSANGISSKELWNTEGFQTLEPSLYMAKAHLLGWVNGVSRMCYYAWDGNDGIEWVYTSGINSVGTAHQQIITWMLGGTVSDLVINGNVYTIQINNYGKNYEVVWNKSGSSSYTTSYNHYADLAGNTGTVSGSITISKAPIILYNDSAPVDTCCPTNKKKKKVPITYKYNENNFYQYAASALR